MKLYFDHRSCNAVSISLTINDEYIGKTRIRKERVTSIEIPSNAERIKISFSVISTASNKVKKKEYENIDFGFEKESVLIEGELKKKEWQYPYDLEIDISKYQEDIVLYPANLNIANSKAVLFYKARNTLDGSWVEMNLVKRKNDFGIKKYRREKLLIGGMFFVAAGFFLFYHFNHYIVDYLPNKEAYENFYTPESRSSYDYYGRWLITYIVAGVIAIVSSLWWIWKLLRYDGMYCEEKMKKTYIFTEHGEIKES